MTTSRVIRLTNSRTTGATTNTVDPVSEALLVPQIEDAPILFTSHLVPTPQNLVP